MATVRDIVTAALRKPNIIDAEDAATAAEMALGVDAYNRMIHAWELAGVDTTHVTQVAGDTFPLAEKYEEGTIYMLASRLSPDYAAPEGFDADDFFRKIQAAYTTVTASTIPQALLRTSSQRRYIEE